MSTSNFAQPVHNGRTYANPASFTGWTGLPSLWQVLKWMFVRSDAGIPNSRQVLDDTLPVERPSLDHLAASSLAMAWLGHATCLVHLDGLYFVTDPVWSDRASPFSFAGAKRYRPPPLAVEELPDLKFGLISHNHYDHLDAQAVYRLSRRFPDMEWFVPLGLKRWMDSVVQGNLVHELNWGEHQTLSLRSRDYQVWCVPAQHWSQRRLFDRNHCLWSGWAVLGPKHKFYFPGDTGFCEEEFRQVGEQLGPFDLASIPIGCYSPRNFMKPQHIDIAEAIRVHQLTRSKQSVGIHWGTYNMGSHEPYLEPRSKLREGAEKARLQPDEFVTLQHGGVWAKGSSS